MSLNKYDSSTGELINIASGSRTWIGTKAAYDAAKQAGTLPLNALICITDDEEDYCHYSTEETKTGNYWIDGKPIYRKVLEGTLPTTAGTYAITHNISNISQVINQYGMTVAGADGGFRELDFSYFGSSTWTSDIYTTNAYTFVQCGTDFATCHGNKKIYIVLEYTKTTD